MKKTSRLKFNDIYFCDFETTTIESKQYQRETHTNVFLWYLKNKNGTYEQLGYNLDSFWNEITRDKANKLIYFHNLSFDGDFIFKFLLRTKPKLFKSNLEHIPKNASYYQIFNNGNKIYKIIYKEVDKETNKQYTLQFQCTYNLLSSSIKSLGKSLGLNKEQEGKELINKGIINNLNEFYNLGGDDMSDEIRNEFIKYIKKDVEIARLSYINFEKNILDNNNLCFSKKFNKNVIDIKKFLTIGSLVYSISENWLFNFKSKKDIKGYKINGYSFDLAKNWIYGGWTQFNPSYHNKYIKNLNGLVIDINSSYPYQMTKLLPVGEMQEYVNNNWLEYLTYYKIDVKQAKIKEEYKDFIILKNWNKLDVPNDRYVRELKNFTCYYSKDEWEFLNKIYDFNVLNIKKYYCEAKYLLKSLIEELYYFKNYYAKLGQDANKLTYKIMLNSLYGRQCKRKIFDNVIYVNDDELKYIEDLALNGNLMKINKKDYIVKTFKQEKLPYLNLNGVAVEKIANNKNYYTNILIGAQITSYARLQLWETIYKIGVDRYMYCDTDSIFFKDTNKEDLINNGVKLDKFNLGDWDVECELNEGKILGAKRYAFIKANNKGVKCAMCGLNDLEINEDNIDELLQDGEILPNAQKFIKKDDWGIIINFRDFQIKKGNN